MKRKVMEMESQDRREREILEGSQCQEAKVEK